MIGDKIATNADLMATDGVDDGKSTPVTAAVRVALEAFAALEAYVALEAVEFDDCLCCYSCC